MKDSLQQFNDALRRFVEKTIPEKHVVIVQKVALQIVVGCVLKTPVRTGRARGGWQLDLGFNASLGNAELDADGLATIGAAQRNLAALQFGQAVTISNNVHYIIYLENGSSDQAPNGMLAQTLDEVRSQFT